MNQLCKVCGEPAAGFHFGAFTCEGCKSFFGRTYNNLSQVHECKNGGQCVINKQNRTSCKACRLRKCLMVGMSKSGSRYGRRSNWFKIHCLLQEQASQLSKGLEGGGGGVAGLGDTCRGGGWRGLSPFRGRGQDGLTAHVLAGELRVRGQRGGGAVQGVRQGGGRRGAAGGGGGGGGRLVSVRPAPRPVPAARLPPLLPPLPLPAPLQASPPPSSCPPVPLPPTRHRAPPKDRPSSSSPRGPASPTRPMFEYPPPLAPAPPSACPPLPSPRLPLPPGNGWLTLPWVKARTPSAPRVWEAAPAPEQDAPHGPERQAATPPAPPWPPPPPCRPPVSPPTVTKTPPHPLWTSPPRREDPAPHGTNCPFLTPPPIQVPLPAPPIPASPPPSRFLPRLYPLLLPPHKYPTSSPCLPPYPPLCKVFHGRAGENGGRGVEKTGINPEVQW
ncbi:hypothetical protein O3P69_011127 [Scylla paramamosain]|uniref:Nuclear receptor domain-containing protein n=1 Tax=Scylla paramamosain TaxID=85552 RepID=A0AAW0SUE1_SCYPA